MITPSMSPPPHTPTPAGAALPTVAMQATRAVPVVQALGVRPMMGVSLIPGVPSGRTEIGSQNQPKYLIEDVSSFIALVMFIHGAYVVRTAPP